MVGEPARGTALIASVDKRLKAVADALKAPAKKGKAKVADADETPAAPVEVRPHPDGVYAGAIGAALWGAYRHERLASEGAAVLEAPVCN